VPWDRDVFSIRGLDLPKDTLIISQPDKLVGTDVSHWTGSELRDGYPWMRGARWRLVYRIVAASLAALGLVSLIVYWWSGRLGRSVRE